MKQVFASARLRPWLSLIAGILVLTALVGIWKWITNGTVTEDISLSEFLNRVESGELHSVTIWPERLEGLEESAPREGPLGPADPFAEPERSVRYRARIPATLDAFALLRPGAVEIRVRRPLAKWPWVLLAAVAVLGFAIWKGLAKLGALTGAVTTAAPIATSTAPIAVNWDVSSGSPSGLVAELRRHVRGQDRALEDLAITCCLHLRRDLGQDGAHVKPNLLLVGPTGVGKTHAVRCLAHALDVPLAAVSCSLLTPPGFLGGDFESALWELYIRSGKQLAKAQRGIVFLDEIDKITSRHGNVSLKFGNVGVAVQQTLLRVLEGEKVDIGPAGGLAHPSQPTVQFDTRGLLFVAAGSFRDLEKIRSLRRAKSGWGALPGGESPSGADLVRYGLLPELVGRFPIRTHLDRLDLEDLSAIVSGASNGEEPGGKRPDAGHLRELLARGRNGDGAVELTASRFSPAELYRGFLASHGVGIAFTPAALERIAREAVDLGTGARALGEVLYRILRPLLLDPAAAARSRAWGRKHPILLTSGFVEHQLRPDRPGRLSPAASLPPAAEETRHAH
ncbi:MAG: AAA family ATPase [Holophagales bacterium]|nr:AAA family ATPase [Holophagales bacterium]